MIYECHGHIVLDGVAYTGAAARHRNGPDKEFIRSNLRTCANNGITFYRDGGDKHGASVYAKTIAAEYSIDYRTPAYIIHKRGCYGGMFGKAFESISEYRELVGEAIRLGADFIKTTASGLLDFTRGGTVTDSPITQRELYETIRIAHGEGCAVMVHANGADNIKRAVESGADSIEHGFYMDGPALLMMAQTGAVWVPTCATVANLIGSGRYDDSVLRMILEWHKETLIEASETGVPVACGSDSGASYVPQRSGAHDEMSILESLGINPGRGNRIIKEVFIRKC